MACQDAAKLAAICDLKLQFSGTTGSRGAMWQICVAKGLAKAATCVCVWKASKPSVFAEAMRAAILHAVSWQLFFFDFFYAAPIGAFFCPEIRAFTGFGGEISSTVSRVLSDHKVRFKHKNGR